MPTAGKKPTRRPKIAKDPLTGLPVLDFGVDAPELTSKEVAEILETAKAADEGGDGMEKKNPHIGSCSMIF